MFIWSICKDAYSFSDKENLFVKEMLSFFRDRSEREGAFIHQLELDDITFMWSRYMKDTLDSEGIMGSWSLLQRNKVYIVPGQQHVIGWNENMSIGDDNSVESGSYILGPLISSTIVHELIHKWQFQLYPLLYILNRMFTCVCDHIPFLRSYTLEEDAREHSTNNRDVITFFNALSIAYDNYIYYLRRKKAYDLKSIDPNTSREEVDDMKCAMDRAYDTFSHNDKSMRDEAVVLASIMI